MGTLSVVRVRDLRGVECGGGERVEVERSCAAVSGHRCDPFLRAMNAMVSRIGHARPGERESPGSIIVLCTIQGGCIVSDELDILMWPLCVHACLRASPVFSSSVLCSPVPSLRYRHVLKYIVRPIVRECEISVLVRGPLSSNCQSRDEFRPFE